ncbi:MAG: gliding motility-associated C-terminal domain-containing protein [Bacteroidota bacterium]
MRTSNWRTSLFFIFFLAVLLSGQQQLQAQIAAPEFRCVVKDTLFWDLPNNTCGSFNAYLIYFSDVPEGPFSLLSTITDPSQTQFYHDNPSEQLWYYYLESDFDCPGEPRLQSRILDNRIPDISPISVVSVQGGIIQIEWPDNPAPEVVGYIIYRTTDSGTIPIDTILQTTGYTDLNAEPDMQSEIYYVVAMDDCGNTSIFGSPHATIFLETSFDVCEQKAILNWSSYVGWEDNIESQEVWLSINGEAEALIAQVSPEITSYVYENVEDQSAYCFYIRANQGASNISTTSNEVCQIAEVVQPANQLFLENASVNAANQVELTWRWNTNAELSNVAIQRADQTDQLENILDLVISDPLISLNEFTDPTAPTADQAFFYRIYTQDQCDSIFLSNSVSTIHLSGMALRNLTNQLSWTSFEHEDGVVDSYDLYRIVNGMPSLSSTFSEAQNVHIDPVDGLEEAEAEVCYFIEAEATVDLPSGDQQTIRSRSNTLCIKQFSTVLIPNAFAPEGRNYEFKPRVLFSQNINYYMAIYDRWGQIVFESRDVDTGWTGKKGDRLLPWGTYTYLIRVEQADGQEDEYAGPFVLLR